LGKFRTAKNPADETLNDFVALAGIYIYGIKAHQILHLLIQAAVADQKYMVDTNSIMPTNVTEEHAAKYRPHRLRWLHVDGHL
jgi:hypothetical protein